MRASWLLLPLALSGSGCDRLVNRLGREPAKACELGLVSACLRAAAAERDPVRRQTLLARGCALGSTAACVDEGAELFNAAPPRRDRRRAGELFARGCAANIALGCRNLSLFLALERHDNAAARDAARRGCALRNADACVHLGVLTEDDEPIRRAAFSRACELGSVLGCGRLANHRVAHDPPSVQPEAVAPLRRACAEGDALCCYQLGVIQRDGVGGPDGPKDLTEAERCFERSCAGDMPDGCINLGQLRTQRATTEAERVAALTHTERACALGDAQACGIVGYERMRGTTVPRDLAQGERMMVRACELGWGPSCLDIARFVHNGTFSGGEARTTEALRRACAAGVTRACAAPARVDAPPAPETPRARRHRRRHRDDD